MYLWEQETSFKDCVRLAARIHGRGSGAVDSSVPQHGREAYAAADAHSLASELFNGFKVTATGNFKLLGAPFGSAEYCAAHTRKRKEKKADEEEQSHRLNGAGKSNVQLLG